MISKFVGDNAEYCYKWKDFLKKTIIVELNKEQWLKKNTFKSCQFKIGFNKIVLPYSGFPLVSFLKVHFVVFVKKF